MSDFYKEIQKDCCGEKHTIVIHGNEDGEWFYELKNHTDQEVRDEVTLAALGHQPCACIADYITVCELCDQIIAASKEKPEVYKGLEASLMRGIAHLMEAR